MPPQKAEHLRNGSQNASSVEGCGRIQSKPTKLQKHAISIAHSLLAQIGCQRSPTNAPTMPPQRQETSDIGFETFPAWKESIKASKTHTMQSAWPASANEVPKVSTKCPERVRQRWRNVAGVKACNQSIQNEKQNVQSAWLHGKEYPNLGVTRPPQNLPKPQTWVKKRPRRIKTQKQPPTRNQHCLLEQMGRQRYPNMPHRCPPQRQKPSAIGLKIPQHRPPTNQTTSEKGHE